MAIEKRKADEYYIEANRMYELVEKEWKGAMKELKGQCTWLTQSADLRALTLTGWAEDRAMERTIMERPSGVSSQFHLSRHVRPSVPPGTCICEATTSHRLTLQSINKFK